MNPVFEYGEEWFKSLDRFNEWNERALYAIFSHLGKPKSMLDVGSGNGWMLRRAYDAGVRRSVGVEIANDAIRYGHFGNMVVHNLEDPLYRIDGYDEPFDLVLCVEVAEHLPEHAADVLCDTLTNFTGKYLVFTAAAPEQGGEGHINCQPQEYWRLKLQDRDLHYCEAVTNHLRETWVWVTGPMFWLPQNLQVFVKPSGAEPVS